ncbi:putative hydrolase [Cyphellophora attinorum]|uniref:Putative hydrolase n=1 Tax=Cyphellophora attinorum TaxID=1664694 RepID=A0A0N1HAD7_9EURO|nr:putative hydrolase [Phialophora attinorum]KPI39546.1 putative hydrolase [Phialophora attinorum]
MNYMLYASLLGLAFASPHPRQDQRQIQWGSCPDGVPDGLNCSKLSVPIDWNTPGSGTIDIEVAVLNATNPEKRLGYLMLNPGGPGGAAIPLLIAYQRGSWYFSDDLREHFDLIAADPRGVGASNPISCSPDLWNERVILVPGNQTAFDSTVDYWNSFSKSCVNATGPLFGHVDTASAAKDIEALRLALGGEQLNWLGFSYGTMLGSQYAELYPKNIRAMVLDGCVDHRLDGNAQILSEVVSYEATHGKFFEWAAQNSTSALYNQTPTPVEIWDEVVSRASASPIPAPECQDVCCSDVSYEEIILNGQEMLICPSSGFTELAQALNDTHYSNNASLFSTPLAVRGNDSAFGGQAIQCLDWQPHQSTLDAVLYRQQAAEWLGPHVRGLCQSLQVVMSCLGWAVDRVDPPRRYNVSGTPNTVLQVNALWDPSTSFQWAVGLNTQIEGAVLVTRNGSGHTSYEGRGEASRVMDRYLVNLTVPEAHFVVQD